MWSQTARWHLYSVCVCVCVCVYTLSPKVWIFSVSIYPPKYIYVVFTSWLLWIMLQGSWFCRHKTKEWGLPGAKGRGNRVMHVKRYKTSIASSKDLMYSTVTRVREYGIIYLKTEQKSLACPGPWGCRVRYDLATQQQQQTRNNC